MVKEDDLGLTFSDFKYGVVFGAISIILYMIIGIAQIWYPSVELDIIQTVIYLLMIFSACTVLVDYYFAMKK